jgi:hypothetical protein
LHTALSAYGLIPESVAQITSVTSLKTARFANAFGEYSHKSVREDLMFGYEPRLLAGGRTAPYATREKALLDLLYLYPFYNTTRELAELRLDRATLRADLDRKRRLIAYFIAKKTKWRSGWMSARWNHGIPFMGSAFLRVRPALRVLEPPQHGSFHCHPGL